MSGPIAEQHFEAIIEAFNGYRSGVRVLVHGVARYISKTDFFESPSSISAHWTPSNSGTTGRVQSECRTEDRRKRHTPIHAGLDWLSDMFDLYLSG